MGRPVQCIYGKTWIGAGTGTYEVFRLICWCLFLQLTFLIGSSRPPRSGQRCVLCIVQRKGARASSRACHVTLLAMSVPCGYSLI